MKSEPFCWVLALELASDPPFGHLISMDLHPFSAKGLEVILAFCWPHAFLDPLGARDIAQRGLKGFFFRTSWHTTLGSWSSFGGRKPTTMRSSTLRWRSFFRMSITCETPLENAATTPEKAWFELEEL